MTLFYVKRLIALATLTLMLAACGGGDDGGRLPTQAVATTPIADLPISSFGSSTRLQITAVPDEIIADADAEYLLLTNIYDRSAPSVVNLEVTIQIGNIEDTGNGSGFVYDTDGHIITNAHVVNDANEIWVTFNDGRVAQAEVVGVDVFSDLAVIRVDVPAEELRPLQLADSDLVRVGQRAIAIGNPFGLSSSMTVGIVSGLGRQLPSAELIDSTVIAGYNNPRIIQVDTQINPGNSGGPLLDSHGEVIGINTAIRTGSGAFEGVGFSVPSNTINRVVPELISDGEVTYSWIGISSSSQFDVPELTEPLDLPVTAGVLLSAVTPGSPAADAGLRGGTRITSVRGYDVCSGGDIIVAVDGIFVRNMDELVAYLVVNTKPNDSVTLVVVRGSNTFETEVTLRARPTDVPNTAICSG
ncbi:MAG: trypsin-like peptidase domain-containing protein [Aggregatilineales bacterium]